MKISFDKKIMAGFLTVLLLFIAVGVVLDQNTKQFLQDITWVQQVVQSSAGQKARLAHTLDHDLVLSRQTMLVVFTGGVLAFILILVCVVIIFREMEFRHTVQMQLRQQKEDLEKVNLELDSFVYTASHDLRAPLRAISSFASFLDEDYRATMDDQARGFLDEIRNGTIRMNRVIEDLLTLSRIGRIKNPYEDVDMNQLIAAAAQRLEFDLIEHHVDFQVDEAIPVVWCDRIKMTEVFVNLIGNAIKFSSKNNPTHPIVRVGYSSQEKFHQFFVKDNGIGIDPQFHQQIFGLFKRLHTSKEYEGTGAGLSIVKRVIEDHAGRIWVESQQGQGAVFYFTIAKNLE